MSWLGNKLYDTRQWWRETVPEPVRKYARATPLGSLYKTAQAAGVGKALRSGEEATTNPDWTGQFTPISFAPTTPSVSDSGGVTTNAYADYGGGTVATPVFQPQMYKGAWYTSPEALMQAQQGDIETSFADKMKYLEETYKEGIAALGQQRKAAREDLENNLKKQLFGLQGYYSAISPDAYQSSQMVNEQGLRDETTQQQERSQSALDRALSSAGRDYTMNKQSLENWRTGAMGDVANAAYDFTRTQPAAIGQPEVTYKNPVYNWDSAEALGNINVFGRSIDQGSAQGKASTGSNTYLGQATNQDKKKKSALSKYLYA